MGELPEEYDDTWLDYLPPEAKLEWLRQGAEGANPPPEHSGALPPLSDPEMAGYVGLSSNPARRAALQGQLEQAQALRQQGMGEYSSVMGAALGGLGSLVNTGMGLHQQRKAQKGLDELTSSEQAARSRFARGAQSWDPAQAANLGILSGDPVLGAYGKNQQEQLRNSDTRGLRGIGLEQAKRRLELLEQEAERKARTGKEKFDTDKWKAQQTIAGMWRNLGLREEELEDRKGDRIQRNEDDLRNELQKDPVYKDYMGAKTALGKLEAAVSTPSPAGDIALITNFMKSQDPGSTVREGEFATAANSGGVSERVRAKYNELLGQGRLTPEQRQDLLGTARRQFEVNQRAYDALVSRYRGLAGRSGVATDRVILPDTDLMRPPGTTPVGGPTPSSMTAPQQTLYDFVKANPTHPRANEAREKLRRQGITPP